MSKFERIYVYLFIILNSISGLRIANISLNSVFVALFAVYVGCIYLFQGHRNKLTLPKNDYFWKFILASIASCIFSLLYHFSIPHTDVVLSYLVNSIIYFVVYILLYNSKKKFITDLSDSFRNGLIYAARIQAAWGIAQIILIYGANININEILFVDILHSTITRDWVMGFYTGNIWNMRITGLNFENSMFALVVCIGATLDDKIYWKVILFVVAILSLSRTGWVMTAGYIVTLLLRKLGSIKKVNQKQFFKHSGGCILGITLAMLAYINTPAIQRQVSNILLRVQDSASMHISAIRHLLYYPYGFDIWLTRSNLLQMLFGYGMRCSGVAFSEQSDICNIIGIQSYLNAWAVECDVIGLLLGGGIIAFITYYGCLHRNYNSKFRDAILIIFFGGITYHYHSISYVIFVLMISSLFSIENRRVTT